MAIPSDKLQNLISAKKKSIASIDKKIKDLQDKRKSEVAELREYEAMENLQKFEDLTNSAKDKGLSIEDLMKAVMTGDFFSLQEKIETNQQKQEENSEGVDGSYE